MVGNSYHQYVINKGNIIILNIRKLKRERDQYLEWAQESHAEVERLLRVKDRARSAEQLMDAMERVLREGHKVLESHQNEPEQDELSAALTAVYMGWKFAAHTGLLPHGPVND